MPVRRSTPEAEAPVSPSTALATVGLTPDAVAALLKEQRNQLAGQRRLPAIKVMPAGVGMFEFTDTNDTVRTFEGVILHTHARNVLWDKAFGEGDASGDGNGPSPACASDDGVSGAVREGFVHVMRGPTPAPAGAMVACGGCRYNTFGSAAMFPDKPGSGKGKACTNQRSVYVLVPDRAAPMELVLSPTSLRALDEYLTTLLNHGVPVVTVRTKFAQVKQERGTLKWSVVTFEKGAMLEPHELEAVLSARTEYRGVMNPTTQPRGISDAPPEAASGDLGASPAAQGDDDLPF